MNLSIDRMRERLPESRAGIAGGDGYAGLDPAACFERLAKQRRLGEARVSRKFDWRRIEKSSDDNAAVGCRLSYPGFEIEISGSRQEVLCSGMFMRSQAQNSSHAAGCSPAFPLR